MKSGKTWIKRRLTQLSRNIKSRCAPPATRRPDLGNFILSVRHDNMGGSLVPCDGREIKVSDDLWNV